MCKTTKCSEIGNRHSENCIYISYVILFRLCKIVNVNDRRMCTSFSTRVKTRVKNMIWLCEVATCFLCIGGSRAEATGNQHQICNTETNISFYFILF